MAHHQHHWQQTTQHSADAWLRDDTPKGAHIAPLNLASDAGDSTAVGEEPQATEEPRRWARGPGERAVRVPGSHGYASTAALAVLDSLWPTTGGGGEWDLIST